MSEEERLDSEEFLRIECERMRRRRLHALRWEYRGLPGEALRVLMSKEDFDELPPEDEIEIIDKELAELTKKRSELLLRRKEITHRSNG